MDRSEHSDKKKEKKIRFKSKSIIHKDFNVIIHMYRKLSLPVQSLLFKPLFDYHFKVIRNYKPKIILEAGSGLGRTSLPYAIQGCRVVLLDISPKVIHEARELYKFFNLDSNVDFVIGDAFNLPFKDGAFDICHNEGVLEHFPPSKSIRLIKEMSRVSSIVIVAVPYWNNIVYNIYKIYCILIKRKWEMGSIDKSVFLGHMERAYTRKQLVKEIKEAGLEPIQIDLIGDGGHMSVILDWILQRVFNIFRRKYPPIGIRDFESPIEYVERLYNSLIGKIARIIGKITFSRDDVICVARPKKP